MNIWAWLGVLAFVGIVGVFIKDIIMSEVEEARWEEENRKWWQDYLRDQEACAINRAPERGVQ